MESVFFELGLTGKLLFAIAAATLGSAFQHGYNLGVVNNPQKLIETWVSDVIKNRSGEAPTKFFITIIWSITVSTYCLGGMFGGLLTRIVADAIGIKGGLLFNNLFIIVGAILEGTSKMSSSYEMLIAGRLFVGVNSGLNAGLTPMYLAEISPVNLRGAVCSSYPLVITISILVAQVVGLKSILGTESLWPLLFVFTIMPAIFQLVTLPFCPESPKYLFVSKGNEAGAQRALTWFRGTNVINDEMDQIRAESGAAKVVPKVTTKELFTNKALKAPLIISFVLMLAQQFSGINAVFFFSTQIFTNAGLSEETATYATLGMGTIFLMMTVVSTVLVEKTGRKTLLLIGFGGMGIDLLLLTFAIIYAELSPIISYICICLILLYVVLFATGPGSIPWFMVSELFNQSARPAATSLAVAVNWAANFMIGVAFLPLESVIGPYVFLLFMVMMVLAVIFIFKKVPETKNKTTEEISAEFS